MVETWASPPPPRETSCASIARTLNLELQGYLAHKKPARSIARTLNLSIKTLNRGTHAVRNPEPNTGHGSAFRVYRSGYKFGRL